MSRLRVLIGVLLLASAGLGACADPGGDGLDAVAAAADELITLIERAPDGRVDPATLDAWASRVGPALMAAVREDARALGPTRRAELAERWAALREALVARIMARPAAP